MNTVKLAAFRKIITAAVLALLLAVNLAPAPLGQAQTVSQPAWPDTETPIQAALAIDSYPAPGEPARLTCTLTTALDAPGSTAQFELPADTRLLDGSLTWQGDLLAGAPVLMDVMVAFDSPGDKSIFCRAHHVVNEDESWGDLAALYLHVGASESGAGFAPETAGQSVSPVVQVSPGDGTQVEGSQPTLPDLSPGDSVPPEPLMRALPEAAAGSEPIDPPPSTDGDLTVTGHWYYYDRADVLKGTPSLVQIVRGDNSAHLAWCYITSTDGSYSCGPFANPGAAGVKSVWRSWVNWAGDGVLTVVNPDVGTSNSLYNAFTATTAIYTFSDGTHNIGSWNIINGNNLERPYWILGDLNAADNYLYNNGGGQAGGPVTVQWKIDSTDGNYYSRGGNIHLTGTSPLSTTIPIHEYGHNVMWNAYGNWMPTNDCPSPHYIQRISAAHCGWTEGWADFLPMAVTGSPYYRWDDGSSVNLETPTWGTSSWDNGDLVEGRVAGALWDILDSGEEGNDLYSDGSIYHIWNLIYNVNNSTFAEFWSSWRSYGYNNSSAGPLMCMYQNTISYRLGPSNDDFTGAWNLPIPSRQTESTVNATTQGIDPLTSCGSGSTPRQSRSVWFRFTPSITSNFEFETSSSDYDTVLSIWTGSPGSFTSHGCSDDYNGTIRSLLNTPLTAGVTYYVEAMSFGDSGGGSLSMTACVSPAVPALTSPANGVRTNDNTPTLTWGTVAYGNWYHYQIARDASFTDMIYNVLTTNSTATPGALADGWYYWRVRSNYYVSPCDSYSAWTTSRSFYVDTTPPTGSLSINGGDAFTNSTSATLSLSAADTGGMSQMRFSNNNSTWTAWEAYNSTKAWTLAPSDGTRTVYVQYRDLAGNISSSFSDTIILDTTPPGGTISINSGAAYATSTAVTLTLNGTDATSGMYQMRFSNNGSTWLAWEAYGTTKSWTLSAGDGGKAVYVQYRDNALNTSGSFTDTITLDTVAPTGSITINSGATYAASANVTLSLSASDTTSGVYKMRFSNNGSSWSAWENYATSKSWTLPTGDGLKTVYVQFQDTAGNASGSFNDTITLDADGPTGSITIAGGSSYTTVTGVTLTLSATDAGSSVVQMSFSNDNVAWSDWESYTTSKAWTLAGGNGTRTVYARFNDVVGNVSTSYSDTIIYDNVAPGGTISINSGAAYATSTTATLTLNASDATSGMYQMRFSNDGSTWSTWEAYGTTKSWTLPAGDGNKTVSVQYRDNALNASGSFSDTITLDTLAPGGTVSINSGAVYTIGTAADLTLSASDATSAVLQMRFSNDGSTWSTWEAYGTSKSWTLAAGDGLKTVYVQFNDAAGNSSASQTDTITLDATAPAGSITIAAGSPYTITTAVTLTLNATDTTSGMYQMRFSNDNTTWSAWEAYGTSKNWTLSAGNGTKTVYAQYNDQAGNISTPSSDTIVYDNVAPGGTISINSGAIYTNSTAVTLTLNASDATSGMNQVRFSNDGAAWSAWEAYEAGKSWTLLAGDGSKIVHVQFSDLAGNTSGSSVDTITLDTTAPSGTISINSGATYAASTSVTLSLSASDATSGVAQMRFSNDGASWSTWEAYNTSKSWTITTGDGAKDVYAQFRDGAGNDFTTSGTITLDSTPPSGTLVINSGAVYATTTGVTLTLSAADALSGVSQMRFSNNGTTWSAWEAYSTSKSWALNTPDETKTVYAQFRDGANNTSASATDTIILDTLAPTGSIEINGGSSATNLLAVTLALSATDSGSGVALMRFSDDGSVWSEWEAYGSVKYWTLPATEGSRTVYVQYQDHATRASGSISDSILYDITAPSSSATSPSTTGMLSFTVSWSGSDALAGIETYDVEYRVGSGGEWMPWLTATPATSAVFGPTLPVTVEVGMTYYFRVRALDRAGNAGSFPVDADTATTIIEQYYICLPIIIK